MADDDEEQRINRLFGSYLYIFPSLLLFLGLIRTIWTAVRNSRVSFSVDTESQKPSSRTIYPPSALTNAFKRYLMYPALFGGRHRQPIGWYTFPTRMETVLVASYWLINIIFLVVRHGEVGVIDGTKLIADRSGVLALWNMPIFFLLAGRNDFLVWLTGWPYGTFHVFHKWIARVSALMAMVHSVAYAVYMYQLGDEARRWNPAYWWNGVSAMIVMGLILCLSVFPIRKKAYEFFLFSHITGVIMFLVFLYYHLKLSKTGMYHPWIWACVSMWAFDRFTRLLRLLILNYGAFSKDPQNHHFARAKFVKGTDVIQLTVYPSAQDVGYFPGAHYFVLLTGTWRFWESHPFTAAGWRSSEPVFQGGPRLKRSLQGSLNDSLRESRLPPRAKVVGGKGKDSNTRQLATLKELGLLKDVPDATKDAPVTKEKKQGRHIYIVKQNGKNNKDIYIVTNNGKGKELTPVADVPERKSSIGRSSSVGRSSRMERKSSGRSSSARRSSSAGRSSSMERKSSVRSSSMERKSSGRSSRTSSAERKAGSARNSSAERRSGSRRSSSAERKSGSSSADRKAKEKERAKAREIRRMRRKVNEEAGVKESEKDSDTDSDAEQGDEKSSERTNESEKFTETNTNQESEKTSPSEEDAEEEIEEEERDLELEIMEIEDEKNKTLSLVIEVEEEYEEEEEEEEVEEEVEEEEEEEEEEEFVEIDQAALSSIASTARRGPQRPKLTFFIKPRKGMTATLANRIREHEKENEVRGFPRGRELEIKCLIEGAYGVNHPLHLYETAVFIGGGVGITTILPYLTDYMERSREGRTLTRRFVFLWTAKEEELVENLVAKKFPKGCLTRADISMQLYVTKSKDGQKKLPGVKYRRPNIPDILAAEQRRLVGRMAVMSCGPSVLVDIVRDSVVGCLASDAERKHIEYFEESY